MKRHESQDEADNRLSRFFDEVGAELCWFAFLITGSWQLSVEAVAEVLDLDGVENWFSPEWTVLWARRLVAAASVAALSPELLESARRTPHAVGTDLTGLSDPLSRMRTRRSAPTREELERALLAIDVFPRCAVLLTVLEGLPIEDAVLLLDADEALVREAQCLGLVELARNIALGRKWDYLLVGSQN